MRQKVHSVSYLAKAEFELKGGVHDLVALPAGAEVVKVSLEVAGNGVIKDNIFVGFKDESAKDYFLNVEPTGLESKHGVNTFISDRDYTATSNKVVVAEVKQEQSLVVTKCVLRVLYFLPSVVEVEY